MQNVKNIELLPRFFADVKNQFGSVDLKNGKFIVALMADFIPGAIELKRCIRLAYESNAMDCIIDISKNFSNAMLLRCKAIDKLVDYSFMDKQIATLIIDRVIVAIYPALQQLLAPTQSSFTNPDEEKRKIVLTRLATVLKNKLCKDLQEQLLIYELFGRTPPEDYLQIRAQL